MMKISTQKPPIYDKIKEVLKVNWDSGLCIVWGDTCHSKNPLSPDLKVHEAVHVEQQKIWTPEKWWEKYLSNRAFRLEQEVEAYKAQIEWLNVNAPRHYKRFKITEIAKDLSGGTYGNICTFLEAKKLLGLL